MAWIFTMKEVPKRAVKKQPFLFVIQFTEFFAKIISNIERGLKVRYFR